jgi:hypothetical protein
VIETLLILFLFAASLGMGVLGTRALVRALKNAAYLELRVARNTHPLAFASFIVVNLLITLLFFELAAAIVWAFLNPLSFSSP